MRLLRSFCSLAMTQGIPEFHIEIPSQAGDDIVGNSRIPS